MGTVDVSKNWYNFVYITDYSQKSPSAVDFFDIDDVAEDDKVSDALDFLKQPHYFNLNSERV